MQRTAVILIALVLAVAGCGREKKSPENLHAKAQAPAQIEFKPYPSMAGYSGDGNLAHLFTFPKPDSKGVIHLKPGRHLLILNTNAPSRLGYPDPDSTEYDTSIILAPGGGQHVEILVDDEASSARISTSFPIDLGPLGDGTHLIRIFLCAADNECVKSDKQMGFLQVNINNPASADFKDLATVAYIQPLRKCRTGNAVLDFALHNVPVDQNGALGDNYDVYTVLCNGADTLKTASLTKWQPYDIKGLSPNTTYTITLQLRKNGAALPPPFAQTTRTFYVASE